MYVCLKSQISVYLNMYFCPRPSALDLQVRTKKFCGAQTVESIVLIPQNFLNAPVYPPLTYIHRSTLDLHTSRPGLPILLPVMNVGF